MTQDDQDGASPSGRDVPGFCTFCRSRCGSLSRIENGRLVSVRPDPEHPTGRALCPKGRAAPEIVHGARRLARPLLRTRPKGDPDPGFREIGWDEALDLAAEKLRHYAAETGPESVAFSFASPSATSISDAIGWLERFVWRYGSPNISYATELCNWHKDHCHAYTLGTGMPAPDYAQSRLVVLWGHNPEKTWLAQAGALAAARAAGATLAVIDPRRTRLAAGADLWLQPRPGSDCALALALIRELVAQDGHDAAFVRRWSNGPFLVRDDNGMLLRAGEIGLSPAGAFVGWDRVAERPVALDTRGDIGAALAGRLALEGRMEPAPHLPCRPAFAHLLEAAAPYTPEHAAGICWMAPERIRGLAAAIAAAGSRVSYYGWNGIGQHANASQTDRAVAILFALTGQHDAPGGNVLWPAVPMAPASDYAALPQEQAAKALGLAERPLGPSRKGWVTGAELYRAMLEEEPYRIRALVSFGTNILASQPDPERGRRALEGLDFHIHCDPFANPSSAHADLVLPVDTAWERDGLRAGFEISQAAQELVQLRPAMVPPQGGARSDFDIVAGLAERLGFGAAFHHGDWEAAMNEMLAPSGLDTAALRAAPRGIRRPLGHRFRKFAQPVRDGVQGFATPSRRIEIYSETFRRHGQPPVPAADPAMAPDPAHPLVLTTAKNGYYCHTQHRGIAGLRRKAPQPVVDLHPGTAASRGIAEGDAVEICREGRRIAMVAHLDPGLHPGVVVAENGWWEAAPDLGLPGYAIGGAADASYNSLARSLPVDPVSGAPALRSMTCDIRKAEGEAPARWPGQRGLVLAARREEAPGVVSLELARADGGPLPGALPGQFIALRPPGETRERSYSLTGPAGPAPRSYRVAIRRQAGGALSGRLSDLPLGSEIATGSPAGRFTLPGANEFPLVLAAAGIGITPFLGLLETLAASGEPGPEIHLLYGLRDGSRHPFRDRLDELALQLPRLRLRTFFSRPRPQEPAPHESGRIGPEHVDAALIARRARVYLCGPGPMLAAFRTGLVRRGVPDFEIFHEAFAATPATPPASAGPAEVVLARSGVTLAWRPGDGPLLDLAETAGLALPSGCRTGQCESCAVPVISGEAGHFAGAEEAGPERCLLCQAYPLGRLVLDA
ncbi:molybdopterin-dependent oxidoreductase [Poseidonocella sp. HB161398]|uniref:molybdopterin-dependent oxidoreductase n=1 Tax=Poseidonocella sp. HB161398 TaxID=2320855 RepID=UPI001108AF3D|nr:molybdopterin-dependent oxidoreductase [Poseidonocella sp. HB161398]